MNSSLDCFSPRILLRICFHPICSCVAGSVIPPVPNLPALSLPPNPELCLGLVFSPPRPSRTTTAHHRLFPLRHPTSTSRLLLTTSFIDYKPVRLQPLIPDRRRIKRKELTDRESNRHSCTPIRNTEHTSDSHPRAGRPYVAGRQLQQSACHLLRRPPVPLQRAQRRSQASNHPRLEANAIPTPQSELSAPLLLLRRTAPFSSSCKHSESKSR